MNWEAIRSISNIIAVVFALIQITRANRQARVAFEDVIAKEYRELVRGISAKVFIGEPIDETEKTEIRYQLFRYFELTNHQIFLRINDRISSSTWKVWSDGIQANMRLSEIDATWKSIADKQMVGFSNLERLIKEEYKADPKEWDRSKKLSLHEVIQRFSLHKEIQRYRQ